MRRIMLAAGSALLVACSPLPEIAADIAAIASQRLPEETLVDGDLAVQRGSFTMKLKPKSGGESRDLAGTYVHVYQRKPDGAWALTRAIAAESTSN